MPRTVPRFTAKIVSIRFAPSEYDRYKAEADSRNMKLPEYLRLKLQEQK